MDTAGPSEPDGSGGPGDEPVAVRQDRRETVEQVARWALLAPLMALVFDPERASAGADSAAF